MSAQSINRVFSFASTSKATSIGSLRSLANFSWRDPLVRRLMPHYAAASQQPAFSHSSSAVTAHAPPGSAWNGKGTQEEFMYKDECILVDEKDCIIGHASKYDTHRFTAKQPEGRLHRAFSVFLFNSQNQLLLQQRASTKITFPKVWTNTCCSHPLHGYNPGEVDDPSAVASGAVMGAKRAAVRKLGHELGIPAEQLPIDKFKFLTRLHYCAADDGTYGPEAEWGEHEIDYILFVKADVQLAPNPEEVDAVKYVTFPELTSMMQSSSGLLWSPWFRILATHFLDGWWQSVDRTIKTDEHVDLHTIHKI